MGIEKLIKYFEEKVLVTVSLFVIVGTVLSIRLELISILVCCVSIFYSYSTVRRYTPLTTILKLVAMPLLVGMFSCFNAVFVNYIENEAQYLQKLLNSEVSFKGRVISIDTSSNAPEKLVITVNSMGLSNFQPPTSTSSLPMLILLTYTDTDTDTDTDTTLSPGCNITVHGTLHSTKEFSSDTYRSYLEDNNIHFYVEATELSIDYCENSVITSLSKLKKKFSNSIDYLLPSPHSQLIYGIVYGDSSTFSESFKESLRRTGTSHIVAVSGYNVSVILASINFLVYLFGRRLLSVFQIIFIVVFIFFVGIDNLPVIRAGLMGIVFCVSRLIGRKKAFYPSFIFLVALFFLFDPFVYRDISFQLSFSATFGIVFLSEKINKILKFIPKIVSESLSTTLSAIVFTLPVSMLNFGEVSLIALVVNLFVLPVVSWITIGGIILIIILAVSPTLAQVVAYLLWLPLEYLIRVVNVFSKFRFALIEINPLIGIFLYGLLIILIVVFLRRKNVKNST